MGACPLLSLETSLPPCEGAWASLLDDDRQVAVIPADTEQPPSHGMEAILDHIKLGQASPDQKNLPVPSRTMKNNRCCLIH